LAIIKKTRSHKGDQVDMGVEGLFVRLEYY